MVAPGKGRVKRRLAAIVAAGALLLSQGLLSFAAYAQQADKLPRVGVLTNSPLTSAHYAAFQQALRDLGYVEGKNIAFIPKSAQGNADLRFPELARELAAANVNVMVVAGDQGLRAAKEATVTIPIPIVALVCEMPDRLMASMARPDRRQLHDYAAGEQKSSVAQGICSDVSQHCGLVQSSGWHQEVGVQANSGSRQPSRSELACV
jgi:hypothetical protein